MALFKSNSSIVGTTSYDFGLTDIIILPYIQSANYEIKYNRISEKHIGDPNILNNQLIRPDISINLTYLLRADFLNETAFGFEFSDTINESDVILLKLFEQKTSDLFIFNNEDLTFDLSTFRPSNMPAIYQSSNWYVSSFPRSFLNGYSISFKVGSIPIASANFIAGDMRVSALEQTGSENVARFKYNFPQDYKEINIYTLFDNQINTANAKSLNYINNIVINTDFSQSQVPLIILETFSQAVIKSLDISVDLNRNKFYFFTGIDPSYEPFDPRIILPVNCNLNINGLLTKINASSLQTFFKLDKKFNLEFIFYEKNKEISRMKIENITVESFSYSAEMNQMVEFVLNCSFKMNKSSGLKIQRLFNPLEDQGFLTADNYYIISSNGYHMESLF